MGACLGRWCFGATPNPRPPTPNPTPPAPNPYRRASEPPKPSIGNCVQTWHPSGGDGLFPGQFMGVTCRWAGRTEFDHTRPDRHPRRLREPHPRGALLTRATLSLMIAAAGVSCAASNGRASVGGEPPEPAEVTQPALEQQPQGRVPSPTPRLVSPESARTGRAADGSAAPAPLAARSSSSRRPPVRIWTQELVRFSSPRSCQSRTC